MKEGEEFYEQQMQDLPELYKDLAWTDPETNLVWLTKHNQQPRARYGICIWSKQRQLGMGCGKRTDPRRPGNWSIDGSSKYASLCRTRLYGCTFFYRSITRIIWKPERISVCFIKIKVI
jgi:hypothetical protein